MFISENLLKILYFKVVFQACFEKFFSKVDK